MAVFYAMRIKQGKLTVKGVPKKWRATVESLLKGEEV